jgi:AcrR family transcriptional regulator
VARTGRRPGEPDTRERIADAARRLFAERGFDRTSIRAVAAEAGVDPALVHHYFGTKQRLFVAATRFPFDPREAIAGLVADGPPEGLGERFVRFVISLWDRPDVRPTVTGVVRSATTDPEAAAMARRMLAEGPLLALTTAIRLPDAELRAALASSQLMGIAFARYVLAVEPLASMSPDALGAAVGPVVQRYLTGDLGLPDATARG